MSPVRVRSLRTGLVGVALVALTGCGSEADVAEEPQVEVEEVGCSDSEILVAETCVPVGVASCPEGFESLAGGCAPILPAEPCPPGEMALPGETSCRPVAPCGEGPWDGIPVDATTTYVDASFVGASDGSAEAPYTDVFQAAQATPSMGLVALAPGTYEMGFTLAKPLRFWGRCPADVHWTSPPDVAVMNIRPSGAGTEIHRIGFTGDNDSQLGISAQDVLLDRVWLHDTGFGIAAIDVEINAQIVVRDSLVESASSIALFAGGSTLTVERSVVRDMRPGPNGFGGAALVASVGLQTALPSQLLVDRSVIDGALGAGISADGSPTVITNSVIRNVGVDMGSGSDGEGVVITTGLQAPGTPSLWLEGTTVEATHTAGILVEDAPAEIHGATIRDVAVGNGASVNGEGIVVQTEGGASSLRLTTSLVEATEVAGLLALDADVTLEGMLVRDLRPGPDALFGDGAVVVGLTRAPAAAVSWSRVDAAARAGLAVFGASLSLESSTLRCNPIDIGAETQGAFEPSVADEGGNECRCGDEVYPCQARSANLAPPLAL